jgi:hypothetical protein
MTTTSGNDSVTKCFTTEKTTVSQPNTSAPTTPIVTGTVGRSGVVEYTKATPKVVNETYDVTKK